MRRPAWWGVRRHRDQPPPAARAALDRDERVLAWAAERAGGVVIATQWGLWLPEPRRLGWHRVDKATWREGLLTIVEADEVADGVIAEHPPRSLPLPEPGNLPAVVRERVTRSVAYTAHHPLPGGGGVRVIARRVPGRDGVSWMVRYDAGTDRAEPAVQARADLLLDEARGHSGLG